MTDDTPGERGGYGFVRPSAEADDYEAEWNDLDEKVILAQILAELQQIRMLLSDADSATGDAPTEYQCKKCPATVPAEDRERHAREQHAAPPGSELALFEAVE